MFMRSRAMAAVILLIMILTTGSVCAAGSSFPFSDVSETGWYRSAVEDVYERGLMTGVSSTSFAPEQTVSRAAAVQVLYRLANGAALNETEAEEAEFADVEEGSWYSTAVAWACRNGLTTGVTDTIYAPDADMTREQLAVMLYRYADALHMTETREQETLESYSDGGDVSSWAEEAMTWAVSAGLLKGTDGMLRPSDGCTRAELAVLILRFAELIETDLTLTEDSTTIQIGDTAAVPVESESGELCYLSSDPSVLSVSEDGKVTALQRGTAEITVWDGGQECSTFVIWTVRVVDPETTIVLIPLDDRPVNTDRVELLAETLQWDLILPEEEYYQTVLGVYSEDGTDSYGDPEALAEFLTEMEAAGYDHYIISLDQLYSGGLMSDRVITDEISWDIIDECQSALAVILADPDNQVILLDSVERLATSVDFYGYDQATYSATRTYGMQARKTVSFSGMTAKNYLTYLEKVFDSYTACAEPLTDGKMSQETYLATRERNLTLTTETMELIRSSRADVYYYVGIDDSDNDENIQTNEVAYLERLAEVFGLEQFEIRSGMDELSLLALLCMIQADDSALDNTDTVRVYCSVYGEMKAAADQYSAGTAEESLTDTLDLLQAEAAAESTDADIQLLILADSGQAEQALEEFQANMEAGQWTIVLDLTKNAALGRAILEELGDGASIRYLLAYSSWNTTDNRIGLALSEGIGRYLSLSSLTDAARAAYAGGLCNDFMIDLVYQEICGNTLNESVLAEYAEAFSGLTIADFTLGEVSLVSAEQPWGRSFEARIILNLSLD